MNNKKYSVFITALFCLFIFGFGIALLVSPSRDFSEQENRYLSQFKAPTPEALRSGEFMEDFEDYVTDQFPLRDQWIQLKALSERTLGKQENNKVYFGQGNGNGQPLFAYYTIPTPEDLAKRVGFVNKLADNLDVPVYFSLIPDKSYVWAGYLPNNAPNVDDGSTIVQAGELCSDRVSFIDLRGSLGKSGSFCGTILSPLDEAFYRTDHHWTTMGAYWGYLALMEGMGGSGGDYNNLLALRSEEFYGTTWSSAGAAWVEPDSIYTMIPEGGTHGNITVTGYPEGKPIESSLYHPEKLKVKDKYAYFLGGNQPLCVIQNPDAPNGKLLVIRDSYADSLAPFLAEEFREVHLFDLRYNNTPLTRYAADNEIDQVLVLYSANNFNTDGNLFKMGM